METASIAEGGVVAGTAMQMQEQEQEQQQKTLMKDDQKKMRKVMVAIDDSDCSFYALRWALDNLFNAISPTTGSNHSDEAMLTVVHVQQPFQHFAYPAGPGGATAFYASSSVLDSVRKAEEEISAAVLSRALQMCRGKAIKTETLILHGDPKDMICEAADEMHVDLLVVGSRGLGRIKRAFLGSVSDYCTHHAKCPILIVKPPKETNK